MQNPFRQPLKVKSITFPYAALPPRFIGLQKEMDNPTNECPTHVTIVGPDGTGPTYKIDRIGYIRPGVAKKAGGVGTQYHVMFNGGWYDIYHSDEWFMESKTPLEDWSADPA